MNYDRRLPIRAIDAHVKGNLQEAERLLRELLNESGSVKVDRDLVWAAYGMLGTVLKERGEKEEGMEIWFNAFIEGSTDHTTIVESLKQLARKHRYCEAITEIERILSAKAVHARTVEFMKNQLAKCRTKLGIITGGTPIYSFHTWDESPSLQVLWERKFDKLPLFVSLTDETVTICEQSANYSNVTTFDLKSGDITLESIIPAKLSQAHRGDRSSWLAIASTNAGSPSSLYFFDHDCNVVKRSAVPFKATAASYSNGRWFVGCRDGNVYAFDRMGEGLWQWELPEHQVFIEEYGDSQDISPWYFAPIPFQVYANDEIVLIAPDGSGASLYALSRDGEVRWHHAADNALLAVKSKADPTTEGLANAYGVLGLQPAAGVKAAKAVYRNLVKKSHPDLRPNDPNATNHFIRVQEAYEDIVRGAEGKRVRGEQPGGIYASVILTHRSRRQAKVLDVDSGLVLVSFSGSEQQFELPAGQSVADIDFKGEVHHVRFTTEVPDEETAQASAPSAIERFRSVAVLSTMLPSRQ